MYIYITIKKERGITMSKSMAPYDGKFTDEQRKKMFGEALKAMREARGMTQAQICKILNIKPQTYNTYENGTSNPTIETLVRLSYILDCSVDTLVQRDNIYGDADAKKAVIEEFAKQTEELLTNEKIQSNEAMTKVLGKIMEFFELANKHLDNK